MNSVINICAYMWLGLLLITNTTHLFSSPEPNAQVSHCQAVS